MTTRRSAWVLRRAPEHLSPHAWARLETGLGLGDPEGEATQAWMAAHELRFLYRRLARSARCPPPAARRADPVHLLRGPRGRPPGPHPRRLAGGLLASYFTTGGVSNGPTEAMDLLIKRSKRVGFGFRNFDNYKLRASCCTADSTGTATPIKGRLLRLVA